MTTHLLAVGGIVADPLDLVGGIGHHGVGDDPGVVTRGVVGKDGPQDCLSLTACLGGVPEF